MITCSDKTPLEPDRRSQFRCCGRRLLALGILASGAFVLFVGCGHTRATIESSRDIRRTSSSEYLIEASDLPLKEWPSMQKFTQLSDLGISGTMTPAVVDDCLVTLSQLNLPKLRALRLGCSSTDRGLRALTNLPSITGLDLYGPYITDDAVRMLAERMPHLKGISFSRCASVTCDGYLSLTNAGTLREVCMSVESLNQAQLERIMTEVGQVTYWGIDLPKWKLALEPLRRLKVQRGLTIVLNDATQGRDIDDMAVTESPNGVSLGAAVTRSDAELASALIGTWQSFPTNDPGKLETESTYNADGTVTGFTIESRSIGGAAQETRVLMRAHWRIKKGVLYLDSFESNPPGLVPKRTTKRYLITSISKAEVFFFDMADGEEFQRRRKS